ncbi:hypothetical protein E2C01_002862 [Portunus trituberculatus]|uniref:Uncharacterized protein n=1 Tax=Portunus trituberculatus TaxID=210409 RepID=A0A5B7CL08_PORTR|nr:hypothetical protein [Portunus trituberculatus]
MSVWALAATSVTYNNVLQIVEGEACVQLSGMKRRGSRPTLYILTVPSVQRRTSALQRRHTGRQVCGTEGPGMGHRGGRTGHLISVKHLRPSPGPPAGTTRRKGDPHRRPATRRSPRHHDEIYMGKQRRAQYVYACTVLRNYF